MLGMWTIRTLAEELSNQSVDGTCSTKCPEKPEGEVITPVVTMRPQTEPTIEVTIQHYLMVDTGATHSCIGKEGLPLSETFCVHYKQE